MPRTPITSRHNPRVKEAASLRNRRQREQRRETLVYGARESLRALDCGAQVHASFLCPELLPNEEASRAAEQFETLGVEVFELTREVFEKLAYGDRLDGVVSVVATAERKLENLQLDAPNPLIVVIEGVEKPGNLGALLRTADGAGVDAVLVADPVIDLDNPNAVRASVGMTFKQNIAVASASECLAWLASRGVQVFAARPDAEKFYWEADLSDGVALVFGAEADGLTDTWSGAAVTPIVLPMRGHADSLNVSASAAVLLYDAVRQRSLKSPPFREGLGEG